jgi:hypothetical protein
MHPAQMGYRTRDSETRANANCKSFARDAFRSQVLMMCRLHLVVFAALIAAGSVPVYGATPGSVSGTVRDSTGVPQIGAVVQLLRPDLTIIASVYTDADGRFKLPTVLPGHYAVKAMGTSFLPSLRENVRVRGGTVVNLTLSTLYEVMQWLPSSPRADNAQKDDWAWTLRSAANRPLLRWLEDGPLVVVSDGSGAAPKLKARLMATGQEGTFGESGERISASVEETPSDSRELLARVDFAPNTDAGMESMLGFRQDLGFAGSVQSVAAVSIHPDVDGGGSDSLDEAAVRTSETMQLGDEFEAEVGSTQVLARFADNSPNTVAAALPFASVGWRNGNSTIRYAMTTVTPNRISVDDSQAQAWMPQLSLRNGELAVEHGMHQEIGWERRTDASGMSVVLFADKIDNPIVEGMGHFATGNTAVADTGAVLFDRVSGMLRGGAPGFTSSGMLATVDRRLPGGNQIRLSYANGGALVMSPGQAAAESLPSNGLAQVIAAARARRAQTYSISLSGTLEGTGTRWRASYRWQPEDTVTPVASYATNAAEPYLTFHLRQPIYQRRDGTGGIEALFDLRNLLAEGYQPVVLSDGSVIVFAQDQRSFTGGLAFTF